MSDSIALPTEYNELLDSIKQMIAAGRLRAARAVTNAMIETYWAIGHEIVVRRREQRWGAKVADQLAADLRTAHPDMRGLHERSQPALTTFDTTVPDAERKSLRELVKDLFILDFLAADPARERDLSRALTDNIIRFLRELGAGWAFIGAEVPVQCGDREFFLDLLFHHCKLHRYVVIELKLGRFEPEYVGKLNFYVQPVDDKLRDHLHDQATLGILLVVGRDDVTVEVALRGISTPLAVTEWRRLPPEVRRALPTTEDLTEPVTRTVREIESAA